MDSVQIFINGVITWKKSKKNDKYIIKELRQLCLQYSLNEVTDTKYTEEDIGDEYYFGIVKPYWTSYINVKAFLFDSLNIFKRFASESLNESVHECNDIHDHELDRIQSAALVSKIKGKNDKDKKCTQRAEDEDNSTTHSGDKDDKFNHKINIVKNYCNHSQAHHWKVTDPHVAQVDVLFQTFNCKSTTTMYLCDECLQSNIVENKIKEMYQQSLCMALNKLDNKQHAMLPFEGKDKHNLSKILAKEID